MPHNLPEVRCGSDCLGCAVGAHARPRGARIPWHLRQDEGLLRPRWTSWAPWHASFRDASCAVHASPSCGAAEALNPSRAEMYLKSRMEAVEKIAPVALSPLDSCRGRGKHALLPRLRSIRSRPSPKASTSTGCETPLVVLLVVQETTHKVGTP